MTRARRAKNVFYLLCLLLSIYAAYEFFSGDLRFMNVISGSMAPGINIGDVILISRTDPAQIKEGDIITFLHSGTYTTHRVVSIESGGFRTKGDANDAPDAGIVRQNAVVGKLALTIPYLGQLGTFARTPFGFFLFILIPGVLIVFLEIRKMREGIERRKKWPGNWDASSVFQAPESRSYIKPRQPKIIMKNNPSKKEAKPNTNENDCCCHHHGGKPVLIGAILMITGLMFNSGYGLGDVLVVIGGILVIKGVLIAAYIKNKK